MYPRPEGFSWGCLDDHLWELVRDGPWNKAVLGRHPLMCRVERTDLCGAVFFVFPFIWRTQGMLTAASPCRILYRRISLAPFLRVSRVSQPGDSRMFKVINRAALQLVPFRSYLCGTEIWLQYPAPDGRCWWQIGRLFVVLFLFYLLLSPVHMRWFTVTVCKLYIICIICTRVYFLSCERNCIYVKVNLHMCKYTPPCKYTPAQTRCIFTFTCMYFIHICIFGHVNA